MNGRLEPSDGMFRRFLLALWANVGVRATGIVVQVLGVAAFVRFWGVHLYGEWLVLTAVPAYLTMSDLGFSAAAANRMCIAHAQDRLREAEQTFRACLGLVCAASLVVVLLVTVLAHLVDPARLLRLSAISSRQAVDVLEVLAVQVAISLFGEILLGGFRCANRFAEGLMINNIGQVIEFIATLGALYVRATPAGLAAAILIGRASRMGLLAVGARRRMRQSGLSGSLAPVFSFAAMRALAGPAAGFAAFPLSRALTGEGLFIVIGRFIGPQAVVIVSAGRTLCRLVSITAELLANSIYAEVTTAFARERYELLRRMQVVVSQIALIVGVGATVLIALFRPLVVHVWLGNAVAIPVTIIALLCTSESVSAAYRVSLVILSGTNNHMRASLAYCALSALALALSAGVTAALHGPVEGAVLPMTVSEIAMFFWATSEASRTIGSRPLDGLRRFVSLADLRHQMTRARP
jgi:O-antigen/teichoic acid export membrane protein